MYTAFFVGLGDTDSRRSQGSPNEQVVKLNQEPKPLTWEHKDSSSSHGSSNEQVVKLNQEPKPLTWEHNDSISSQGSANEQVVKLNQEPKPLTWENNDNSSWTWKHFRAISHATSPAPDTGSSPEHGGFCVWQSSVTTNLTLTIPLREVVDSRMQNASTHANWVHTKKHPHFWINTHSPGESIASTSLHKDGVWDVYIHDTLVRILDRIPQNERRRHVVIDVGANIGYFSLLAASLGYNIIAFEPMLFNLQRFATSIERNGFQEQVQLYNNAVGSGHDLVSMRPTHHLINKGNFAVQRDSARHPAESSAGVYGQDYVASVLLDDVVSRDILAMKVDVETFEVHVLDGARELICNNVVQNVIMEYDEVLRQNEHADCSTRKMLDWMIAVGYDIVDVIENPTPLNVQDWDTKKFPPNLHFRLLDTSVAPRQRLGACP